MGFHDNKNSQHERKGQPPPKRTKSSLEGKDPRRSLNKNKRKKKILVDLSPSFFLLPPSNPQDWLGAFSSRLHSISIPSVSRLAFRRHQRESKQKNKSNQKRLKKPIW
jgi:hypothetical protein